MCSKSYFLLSGVIFGVVAVFHLLRAIYHVPIQVTTTWTVPTTTWIVPMWPSWAGLAVAGILCIWAFGLLFRK